MCFGYGGIPTKLVVRWMAEMKSQMPQSSLPRKRDADNTVQG